MKKTKVLDLENKILKLANKEKAKLLSRYFKTAKGQYGEGDVFLGLTVPLQRQLAKDYTHLSFSDLQKLLNSKYHEFRLIALIILVNKFNQGQKLEKKDVVEFYIKNLKNINNWDLVDLSCYNIIGAYLFDKDRDILYKLANSKHLWSKRVAIVSSLYFIRRNDLNDIFKLSTILLSDEHDLIHKAVGWMLREAGKKDQPRLEKFLLLNRKQINRTTWRYSIEKFSPDKKKYFMSL